MSKDRKRWVEETQSFQRIAGVKVTPTEELEKEWDDMRSKQRKAALSSSTTNNIIQKQAIKAAKERRN